jgi:hypothetical protein
MWNALVPMRIPIDYLMPSYVKTPELPLDHLQTPSPHDSS